MAYLVRSNLQQLIIVLAFLSAVVSMFNLFFVGYHVQKKALLQNSLEIHEAYATKLADSANLFLDRARSELNYSADKIGNSWSDLDTQKTDLENLKLRNRTFDSLLVVNASGEVTATSNNIDILKNQYVDSIEALQALQSKKALITAPYQSKFGDLIIMMSEPIFSPQGQYLGFLSASLYLQENQLLNRLLGEHYHKDDSYTYVVDRQKQVLYHPDKNVLGKLYPIPLLDDFFLEGKGTRIFTNHEGVEMLGGFATIPAVDWLVVSQRPVKSALQVHEGLMLNVVLKSLPVMLLMLLIIWGLAWLISNPLRQLAQEAKNMRQSDTLQRVQGINTWYFEANELKKAFLTGLKSVHQHVGQLKIDTRTDVLTGLNNRRGLDSILAKLTRTQTPFALLALDIDRFKQVNDNHGHLVGDLVLKELANLLRANVRNNDFCVRLGGEEFVILLPHCSLQDARFFAERLRLIISQHSFPTIDHLTVSCGVAAWPLHASTTEIVFRMADEMLYQAKQNGRNQIRVANPSAPTVE